MTRWRAAELLLAILIGWIISRAQAPNAALRVLKVDKAKGVFSAAPMIAPVVLFEPSEGEVAENEILICPKSREKIETTKFSDHVEELLVLHCDGGKTITLKAVYFQ